MTIAVEQVVANTTETTAISVGSGDGWSTPTTGNVILAFASKAGDSFLTGSITMSGSGWTEVYQSTSNRRYAVFYKVSDGTESTITANSSGSYQFGLVVYEVSNVNIDMIEHNILPWTATSYYSSAASLTMPEWSTPTYEYAAIAFASFEDNDCSAFAYTDGFSVGAYAEDGTGSPDHAVGSGYKIVTDGTYMTTTTVSKVGGFADDWWGFFIILPGVPEDDGKPKPVYYGYASDTDNPSVTLSTAGNWRTATAGNLLLAIVKTYLINSTRMYPTITGPSGFTWITAGKSDNFYVADWYTQGVWIGYKISDGTETSFTASVSGSPDDPWINLTVVELINVDPTNPIGDYDVVENNTTTSTINLSVTPQYDNSMYACFVEADAYSGNHQFSGIEQGFTWSESSAEAYGSTESSFSATYSHTGDFYSGVGALVALNQVQEAGEPSTNGPIIICMGF